MKTITVTLLFIVFTKLSSFAATSRNLILVTMDGVRCQEMFDGFQTDIWQAQQPGEDITETKLYTKYWAESSQERREKLWPFFWGKLMKHHGAIIGDRFKGSVVKLSNQVRVSYPGYSEILTGRANDTAITGNLRIANPTTTVLEFLKSELNLSKEQVATFASWEVMDYIVTKEPDAFFSNSGFEAYESQDPIIQALSNAQFETSTPWDPVRHDFYTFRFTMDYLEKERPRILFLGLGETDDWAHKERYDRVIQSIDRCDRYIENLWNWVQSQDDYKDNTTILFTTDHGRGDDSSNWRAHKSSLEGAAYVWIAAAGNGIEKRGNLNPTTEYSLNQVAATMCQSLGIDYKQYATEIGKPLTLFRMK